jgi:hypothetical protein
MEIIFSRQVRCVTKGVFRTAVDRDNDGVVVNAFYRHSRIKTYLKDGRALRAGTVINGACDIGVLRRLEHFGELTGADVSRRVRGAGRDCGKSWFCRGCRPWWCHRGSGRRSSPTDG